MSHRISASAFSSLADICGNSLTCIIFDLRGMATPGYLTLDQVIYRCPNLRKLYFRMPFFQGEPLWSSAIPKFQHQNLVDMALKTCNGRGIVDISPLLQLTPKLQRLYLSYGDVSARVATLPFLLHQYCPSLVSLQIRDIMDRGILPAKYSDWNLRQCTGVLEELALHDWHAEAVGLDVLHQIINVSHEHLQILELRKNDVFSEDTIAFLSAYTFLSLRRLELSCLHGDHRGGVGSFLAHSVPNLVSLKLRAGRGLANSNLLQIEDSNMKHLEAMELSNFRLGSASSEQLIHFFDVVATSSLRTLVFCKVQSLTVQVLESIVSKCLGVNKLVIERCDNLLIREFDAALSRWAPHFHMNKLKLAFFDKDSINYLLNHDVLRFLEIVDNIAFKWSLLTVPLVWKGLQCEPTLYGTMDYVAYNTRKSEA